jgi:hypothetical protein
MRVRTRRFNEADCWLVDMQAPVHNEKPFSPIQSNYPVKRDAGGAMKNIYKLREPILQSFVYLFEHKIVGSNVHDAFH